MPSNRKILISSVDYDLERLGTVSINLCFSPQGDLYDVGMSDGISHFGNNVFRHLHSVDWALEAAV
jgi:hypothetical protein